MIHTKTEAEFPLFIFTVSDSIPISSNVPKVLVPFDIIEQISRETTFSFPPLFPLFLFLS